MPIFSSSVICASRRAARSSGDSDVFIHGQSCAEAGEPVFVFSIFSILYETTSNVWSDTLPPSPAPSVPGCCSDASRPHYVGGGALVLTAAQGRSGEACPKR